MMKDLARIKKAFTDKTEAEYRSRGYEVARDVALDFYPNFRADLLASRNGETKVIAVQTRTGMAVTSDIVGLSEAIKPIPGWSFELLLVGEPELLNAPPGAEPFDAAGIAQSIAEAERALDAGLAEAAFVLAWSAGEAAVRILAAAAGVEIQRITQTRYLLSHAVYQDAISEREYERLSEMLAYRNAIVHGFAVKDFDAERTKKLIAAAKKLLRAGIASERAGGEYAGRVDLLGSLEPSTAEDSVAAANLRRRLDNFNRHFRRKAAAVLNDDAALRLLAAMYSNVVVETDEFDFCKHGRALAKLTAANFCEIGANSIYITESGQRFIDNINQNKS